MQKPFRFKYANEIAGTFVIVTLVLLLTGIFLAGRAQGWFEGKFILNVKFSTKEGTFGLQEGSEIQILNTIAGRVGKITPTEDSCMVTTFILQNRFKQFISQKSTAKVKKKFGVAGDSYVDIEITPGPPMENGDSIICSKDEEIMETAQKALKNVQDVVLPMLENVQQILANVSQITASIDKGEGTVGTILNDGKMAGDLKQTVSHANDLLLKSTETFEETTRLVKGFQKSWLVRNHIEKDVQEELLMPFEFDIDKLSQRKNNYEKNLSAARAADNSPEIIKNAYNLAVCMMAEGSYAQAKALLSEMRLESERSGNYKAQVLLLEAELSYLEKNIDQAFDFIGSAMKITDKSDKTLWTLCRLLKARLYCEKNKKDETSAQLKEIQSYLKKAPPSMKAMNAHIAGRILMMQNMPLDAASLFDLEADIFKNAESYYNMAAALVSAASIYEQIGKYNLAADRFFRAGRSLASHGHVEPARKALSLALSAAEKTGKDAGTLTEQIRSTMDQMNISSM